MPRQTKQQILDSHRNRAQKEIIEGIHAIAPDLSSRDIVDLLNMSPSRLEKVLNDYKLSKVLNKPKAVMIIKFLNDIKPLVDLVTALARIL